MNEEVLKFVFGEHPNKMLVEAHRNPEIVAFDTIYQTSNDEKSEHVVSIMKFADGSQTKCMLDISDDSGNVPDDYTAFLVCYCKKILGNDYHKTVKYWTEVKPNKDFKQLVKEIRDDTEATELIKKRKERNERKRYKRLVKQKELELRAELEARRNILGDNDET